jgi:hypothetical protein
MIQENQTFDCVLKAMRVGRRTRRPHWPEGMEMYWDYSDDQIKWVSFDRPQPKVWTEFDSMSILAKDWEVLL